MGTNTSTRTGSKSNEGVAVENVSKVIVGGVGVGSKDHENVMGSKTIEDGIGSGTK